MQVKSSVDVSIQIWDKLCKILVLNYPINSRLMRSHVKKNILSVFTEMCML